MLLLRIEVQLRVIGIVRLIALIELPLALVVRVARHRIDAAIDLLHRRVSTNG
jgi:hypothetical protein